MKKMTKKFEYRAKWYFEFWGFDVYDTYYECYLGEDQNEAIQKAQSLFEEYYKTHKFSSVMTVYKIDPEAWDRDYPVVAEFRR